MVKDGLYYGLAAVVVAIFLGALTSWYVAILPLLLGAFFLWFFRDPNRQIPATPGAIVSPGDGKVTDIANFTRNGANQTRISVFLNVFNVHVNRSPISGRITKVFYQKGKFANAMGSATSDDNEQNIVTVAGEEGTVTFKQIAGLIARRIVFTKNEGDLVARGERVGLIKFGSRVDVIFDASATVQVKIGDHVAGGSSVLAILPVRHVNGTPRFQQEAPAIQGRG